ncbi:MAG: hypothetical protein AB7N61_26030 [Acidimicrobiia bacterium]
MTILVALALLAGLVVGVPMVVSAAGRATQARPGPVAEAMTASTGARPVAIAMTNDGTGAWIAFSNGLVQVRGTATFAGDMSTTPLNSSIREIVPTTSGKGYWLIGADGGIFTFGDAPFVGSTGGRRLNAVVVAMAPTPTGQGYWLAASDGGVFTFGDARFFGSMGGKKLNRAVDGISASSSGGGYRLVAADGGVFTFGDSAFFGSSARGSATKGSSVVAFASTPTNRGYWTLSDDGVIDAFGDAPSLGSGTSGYTYLDVAAPRGAAGYALLDSGANVQVFGDVDPGLAGPSHGAGGARCFLGLHGWGYFGEDAAPPGMEADNVQPNGNIDLGYWPQYQRDAYMWVYFDDQSDYPRSRFAQASFDGALSVVNLALAEHDCGQIVVQGFSNGAAFAAKMYCRGETLGDRVVGYIIDDPVTDKGVDGCDPAAGMNVRLYHSTDIANTAGGGGPCRPTLTWFCDGNWRYSVSQYDRIISTTNIGPFKPGHYPSKSEYAAVAASWWR